MNADDYEAADGNLRLSAFICGSKIRATPITAGRFVLIVLGRAV